MIVDPGSHEDKEDDLCGEHYDIVHECPVSVEPYTSHRRRVPYGIGL
jgi:hypothetical protein